MCEANAYLMRGEAEEMVLESVDEVEVEDNRVRMVNIFGEQRTLEARIKRYTSSDGRILLEPA